MFVMSEMLFPSSISSIVIEFIPLFSFCIMSLAASALRFSVSASGSFSSDYTDSDASDMSSFCLLK